MSERSCTDCRWLEEPNERHQWHFCAWPSSKLLPRSISSNSYQKSAVNIEAPFTDCPTWELQALTREQRIEAAAREALRFWDSVRDWSSTMDCAPMIELRSALGDAKPEPKSEPTEAEMEAELRAAGWRACPCKRPTYPHWVSSKIGTDGFFRITEAYARMKASKTFPGNPV